MASAFALCLTEREVMRAVRPLLVTRVTREVMTREIMSFMEAKVLWHPVMGKDNTLGHVAGCFAMRLVSWNYGSPRGTAKRYRASRYAHARCFLRAGAVHIRERKGVSDEGTREGGARSSRTIRGKIFSPETPSD